jgi:hypothetical protein
LLNLLKLIIVIVLKETFSEYETIDSYYICMFTNTVHACKLCNEAININPGGWGFDKRFGSNAGWWGINQMFQNRRTQGINRGKIF